VYLTPPPKGCPWNSVTGLGLDAQQFQAVDDPEVPVNAPTLDEVRAAIKKLKFGRAPGRDAIPPEMLKLAIDPTSRILHQLFASVWATGKVPCAWKEGIIISLYKGKGPRNEMNAQATVQSRCYQSPVRFLPMYCSAR